MIKKGTMIARRTAALQPKISADKGLNDWNENTKVDDKKNLILSEDSDRIF